MSYQIADEPHETSLRDYVVRPSAPMFAMMTAGAWLAWPWFAFNAVALGSPTKRREIALCAAAFALTAALAAVLIALVEREVITTRLTLRLCLLGIVAWKLSITYYISAIQGRTFHVYEYYGGVVRSARNVIIAGTLLRGFVIGLVDDPLWIIIVMGGL